MAVVSISANGIWTATKAAARIAYKLAFLFLAYRFVILVVAFYQLFDEVATAFYALAQHSHIST